MTDKDNGAISHPDPVMESRIQLEEIRMLYSSMLFSMVATFVVSLIMYVVLYDHVNSTSYLTLWFGVMIISIILRSWDSYCFLNSKAENQGDPAWGIRFLTGSTFAGLWWGMLSWLGYSVENEYQTLIVVCIVGIAGGSLTTLSYRWQTIAFFLIPALGLLELKLVFDSSGFSNVVSYLLAVFILFTLSTSRRTYTNSNQNIRLRIEADYKEDALREAISDAEQANAAKSLFLSNMSHELRTPLHAILGYAQLLQHGEPLTENQLANIVEIDAAGKLLLELVNQILDLARIEKGNITLVIEQIRLEEVIRECYSLTEPQASQKNIDLVVENSCRGQVDADRTRLKQVMLNLITNAIKYNKDGGSVSIKCTPSRPGRIKIQVVDTGHGISADLHEQIFQPFNRLNVESHIEGTGIGLSITKQLIEKMHGSIGVTSSMGKGSVFWIELSGVLSSGTADFKEHRPVKKPAKKNHGQSTSRTGKTRILVVEDSLTNMRLMQHQLKILGYTADLAADGIEAFSLFKDNEYDIMFTDCNMPNMDGYELARSIRNTGSTIPIIALTADAFPEREKKCLAAGINQRLIKPVDLEELTATIDQWLN